MTNILFFDPAHTRTLVADLLRDADSPVSTAAEIARVPGTEEFAHATDRALEILSANAHAIAERAAFLARDSLHRLEGLESADVDLATTLRELA